MIIPWWSLFVEFNYRQSVVPMSEGLSLWVYELSACSDPSTWLYKCYINMLLSRRFIWSLVIWAPNVAVKLATLSFIISVSEIELPFSLVSPKRN